MPINPGIPATAFAGQRPPMTLGQLMNAAKTFEEARQIDAQRKVEQEAKTILQQNGGDWDLTIDELKRRGYGTQALSLQERITKERSQVQQTLAQQLRNDKSRFDLVLPMLNAAQDQSSYDRVRATIGQWSPEIAEMLDPTYDPDRVQQYAHMGLTIKESLDQRRQAVEDLSEGRFDLAAARWASTVQSPEDYQYFLQGAAAMGIPKAIREQFGPEFTPEVQAAAQKKVQELTDAGVGGTRTATRTPTQAEVFERDYISAEAEKIGVSVEDLTSEQLTKFRRDARQAWADSGRATGTGGASSVGGQAGAFERDFIAMRAGEMGLSVADLTPPQLVQLKREARQAWAESGRAPSRAAGTADNPRLPNALRQWFLDIAKSPQNHGIDPTLPLDQAITAAKRKIDEQKTIQIATHPQYDAELAKTTIEGYFRAHYRPRSPGQTGGQPPAPAARPGGAPPSGQGPGDVNLPLETRSKAGPVRVGSRVQRGGKWYIVTAIHPDGTVEAKPDTGGR